MFVVDTMLGSLLVMRPRHEIPGWGSFDWLRSGCRAICSSWPSACCGEKFGGLSIYRAKRNMPKRYLKFGYCFVRKLSVGGSAPRGRGAGVPMVGSRDVRRGSLGGAPPRLLREGMSHVEGRAEVWFWMFIRCRSRRRRSCGWRELLGIIVLCVVSAYEVCDGDSQCFANGFQLC